VNKELITKQKSIADGVLNVLFSIDPYCIVVGGAPRDWYMGSPADDIDVFFYTTPNSTIHMVKAQLEHVGFVIESTKDGSKVPEHYQKNPYLKCVFDCVVQGTKVQLMLMREPTFRSVVPEFPLSLSKVWYKYKSINTTKEFEISVRTRVIFKTSKLYSDGDLYVQKIKNKFKDFEYFDVNP
jgi:hypothetical protein